MSVYCKNIVTFEGLKYRRLENHYKQLQTALRMCRKLIRNILNISKVTFLVYYKYVIIFTLEFSKNKKKNFLA